MKVLVIEDSAAIGALLCERLASMGHEVHLAMNGAHGLQCFMALVPDLVLMDLEMPVMGGLEATRRIRQLESHQRWAWTPVLFLTASNTEDNLLKAIESGADDFLPKSAGLSVIAAKMHAMQRIAGLRHALREANQQLERMAHFDGLTGLANRRALDERTDDAWAEAVRQGQPFGLMLADVDHFKRYNDRYGHLSGDDCLRSLARLFTEACQRAELRGWSAGAFASRYGGEEFCLVFPGIGSEALQQVAATLLDDVRQRGVEHLDNPGHAVVTVSLGLSQVKLASGRVVRLFREADQCLYEAKRLGRNRFSFAPAAELAA